MVQKYIPWGYSSWSWGIGPVIASGHAVLLSWSAAGTTSAAAIASGSQDGVIRNAAIQLKALGGVILLRPFFEFDQPVGHPRYIGSPAQVVAAWQRTYTIFKSVGVPNVRFVWSPMAFDFARGVAQQFWPGSAYVDWVGPDGYNFPGRSFRDWQTIFGIGLRVCRGSAQADDDPRDRVAGQGSPHTGMADSRGGLDPGPPRRTVGQLLRLDQPQGL